MACLDLHAHSKDLNIFAYCCQTDLKGRLLPYILSRHTPLFHFPSCTYGIARCKQTTARAILYNLTKASDVLTIEASFYGSGNPPKSLSPAAFLSFAHGLLRGLTYYYGRTKECLEAEKTLPAAIAQAAAERGSRKEDS